VYRERSSARRHTGSADGATANKNDSRRSLATFLRAEERSRYTYPQVRVIQPVAHT